MKQNSILIILITFLNFCIPKADMIQVDSKAASIEGLSDKASSMIPNIPELDGWGPNPEKLKNGEIDIQSISPEWFYKKFQAKAVPRAIEVNSNSFMESTCEKNALSENKEKIIVFAITSVDPSKISFLKEFEDNKKNVEILKCFGTGSTGSFSDCECVLFFKYSGGKMELQKKISLQ